MMAGHYLMADEMHLCRIRDCENINQGDIFFINSFPFLVMDEWLW